ncbi:MULTISPECIES: efflux transporter outer membrane subunit [Sphingomonadales]|uniref:Transporter n=3 Tax=Sphingomonadaceae TaxID=41297 RepID=A0A2S8AZZ0_9SPHN|nr:MULTISPECIES: efflux transporter outer membrane subunit [Sphingomonadaceae]AGH51676.1 RND-family efflux transporter [Sphingomonas sp. MM-1]AMK20297.1 RND-family efflux transporter [Sphingobium sp. MI1205]EQA96545.1 transporter [Sphingobium baderi LL03]KMS51523.1 transporter [Novosphingobium barchaimii LL02]KMS64458.1 transporter [Sphingobium baderi LL03]
MTTNRSLAALIGLALLGGCAAGTEYRRPALPLPAAFHNAPLIVEPGGRPWWRDFADPMLDDLVARGLKGGFDVEAAMARVDQARAAAGSARAARMPSGSLDGSAVRTRQSLRAGLGQIADYVPDFDRTQDSFELVGGASWELDLAGGLKRGREAAVAELEAAVADSQAVRLTVAAEIGDAYILLRSAQRRRSIAVDQAAAAQKLENIVRARFVHGAAARFELDQSRASTAAISAGIAEFDQAAQAQLARLAVLAGGLPDSVVQALERPEPVPVAGFAAMGLPADLMRRRPDLVAAERRVAAGHARLGVALAEYYPKFTLSGLLGFQGNDAGRLISGPASVVQGGLGLRWRLFDFGRVDAEVARAKGAEREAIAQFRNAALRAAEDVERAVVAWRTAREREAVHAEEVRAATAACDALDRAYRAGHVSLAELVEAQRRVLQAADALALAQGDAARATVAGWRAFGG